MQRLLEPSGVSMELVWTAPQQEVQCLQSLYSKRSPATSTFFSCLHESALSYCGNLGPDVKPAVHGLDLEKNDLCCEHMAITVISVSLKLLTFLLCC